VVPLCAIFPPLWRCDGLDECGAEMRSLHPLVSAEFNNTDRYPSRKFRVAVPVDFFLLWTLLS